jgi:predicted enzyme related to lactoylglutathione lyase
MEVTKKRSYIRNNMTLDRSISASLSILALGLLIAVMSPTRAVAAPETNSGTQMPADVGVGRVAWFDLTTTNLVKSRDFYGKLFDWKFGPVKGSDQALEIVSRGTAIGTLRVSEAPIGPGNGVVYIQVAGIEAACKKAAELGGTVIPGFPFNLPDNRGAIGLIVDPSGHSLGMYSRTPLPEQK